jgi:hypothetical protein
MESFCLKSYRPKLNRGDELRITTKTGQVFKAILFDIKEGYLHTIEALGILVIFPINSLSTFQLVIFIKHQNQYFSIFIKYFAINSAISHFFFSIAQRFLIFC